MLYIFKLCVLSNSNRAWQRRAGNLTNWRMNGHPTLQPWATNTHRSWQVRRKELSRYSGWKQWTGFLYGNRQIHQITASFLCLSQAQTQYQQQHEQQKKELENLHQKSIQQLQNRLSELEVINKDLTERRYKGDSTVRELKAKLSGLEDVRFPNTPNQAYSCWSINSACLGMS